jgi:hypothetical protein
MTEMCGKVALFVDYYDKHPSLRVFGDCLTAGRKSVLACLFRLSHSGSRLELN